MNRATSPAVQSPSTPKTAGVQQKTSGSPTPLTPKDTAEQSKALAQLSELSPSQSVTSINSISPLAKSMADEMSRKLDELNSRRPVGVPPPRHFNQTSPLHMVPTPITQSQFGMQSPIPKVLGERIEKIRLTGKSSELEEIRKRDEMLKASMARREQLGPATNETGNVKSGNTAGPKVTEQRKKPSADAEEAFTRAGALKVNIDTATGKTKMIFSAASTPVTPMAPLPLPKSASPSIVDHTSPETPLSAKDIPEFDPPLKSSWRVYYDRRGFMIPARQHSQNFENTLYEVCTFNTIKTFWSYFNHFKTPSQMEMQGTFHIFKHDIKPMWEDEKNTKGGKWTINFQLHNPSLDSSWLYLVLCMIGETLGESDEISGAVVARRPRGDKISVWTCSNTSEESLFNIGTRLLATMEVINRPEIQMDFSYHKDSMKSGSSYGHSHHSVGRLSYDQLKTAVSSGQVKSIQPAY